MNKKVLITGANRGLGLALCRAYSKNGNTVIAICRRISDELIRIKNVKIIDTIDFSSLDTCSLILEKIKPSSLDVIIHNAGVGNDDDFDTIKFDEIMYQFKVNAVAPLYITKILHHLLHPGSKIALISSRLASIELNQKGASYAYRMAKTALNMVGKNLSIDLKKDGIAVGVYSPGIVDTDMLRALGNFSGANPDVVAEKLSALIETLNTENTGCYWHIDGQILPW